MIMAVVPGPEQVGSRYLSLSYRVRKLLDDRMIVAGLSLARTKVLQVLDAKGPVRQASLAKELGLAQRSITQSVEALARDGFVDRTADPDDGRAKIVTLTDKGASALAASSATGEAVLKQLFGTLGTRELKELDKLLNAVDAAVDAAVDNDWTEMRQF
jgi:DNA-binding MarR family transcriptional regulator